jgi:hypothetical protein
MATTAPKLTYVGLATISKVETTPDGNRLVYGKATDETLDGDKQIVDLKWAKGALADSALTPLVSLTQRWYAMLQHLTAESSEAKLWRSV